MFPKTKQTFFLGGNSSLFPFHIPVKPFVLYKNEAFYLAINDPFSIGNLSISCVGALS